MRFAGYCYFLGLITDIREYKLSLIHIYFKDRLIVVQYMVRTFYCRSIGYSETHCRMFVIVSVMAPFEDHEN